MIFDDIIEEFSFFHKLHEKKQFFISLTDIIELNNIGMPHELKNMYFSQDSFSISSIINLTFFQNLDGHTLACNFMFANFYFTKSALAKSLSWISDFLPKTKSPNYVLPEVVFRFIWFSDYNDIYIKKVNKYIIKPSPAWWQKLPNISHPSAASHLLAFLFDFIPTFTKLKDLPTIISKSSNNSYFQGYLLLETL